MRCYRFRQRDCKCTWSNIHRLGKPFLIALETVAEKIRIPCSHAKKIRIRNLRFRKIHFRERFRKAPFWGPSVFKKLRIRTDTCDRFYVSFVWNLISYSVACKKKSKACFFPKKKKKKKVSMYPGSKSSVFEKTRIRVHVALVAIEST